jgi:nucleoside-diphosphate-sugar epimerase
MARQVDPGVISDPWKDMVEPSTQGTRNILSSVDKNAGRVKHYVHTSSMAAVGSVAGRAVNEQDWSTTTIEEIPYNFAKTEGEKVVWAETRGKPYTVSCINPSMVFGPCLAKPHAKASPYVFRQALYGNPQPNQPYHLRHTTYRDQHSALTERCRCGC